MSTPVRSSPPRSAAWEPVSPPPSAGSGRPSGTFLLPISIDSLGVGVTMLFAAGIALIGVVTSQILAPETMGKTLSETSHAMH